MIDETVCVGVDVAKGILVLAVSNSKETRQFKNDHKGISSAVRYIAGLKPVKIILEATGKIRDSLGRGAPGKSFAWSHRQSTPGA